MSFNPPGSVEEAIKRLPQEGHPLIRDDFAIWYLGECRKILEIAIAHGPQRCNLGSRIIDLEAEEFRLMKQTSFYMDPHHKLDFGWTVLPSDTIWGFQLNHTDPKKGLNSHAYWVIYNALPRDDENYRIVFIESDSGYRYDGVIGGNSDKRIMLAMLSREELRELTDVLGGQDRCVQGDVRCFVEGTS